MKGIIDGLYMLMGIGLMMCTIGIVLIGIIRVWRVIQNLKGNE